MRISSLLATTSIAVAITTTSFALGARNAEPQLVLTALPVDQIPGDTAVTATPGQSSGDAGAPPSSESAEPTSTQGSKTESSKPSASAAPAQSDTATATPIPTEQAPIAQASEVISYKYGDVQVEVVKLGSEITDVNLLVGDATYGRDVAYQTLIQATIQAQGTNYGNFSGATFTTEAFKKAVENALAKF